MAGRVDGALVSVPHTRAYALVVAILRGCGAPNTHAQSQARVLVQADLSGRPSHGLQRLPTLVNRIDNGLLSPAAKPSHEWRTPNFLAVDGNMGFGCVAAETAIDVLREASRTTGVAMAAIRSASHLGALAPYVEQICCHGCIGVVLTTTEALVHPAGGRIPMVGTNPIGIGIPAAPHPVVLDMSTGAISAGEILARARQGLALPLGCAIDAGGNPTTDPERARAGAISPFGGAKGYGLALALELLVASLSGTSLGQAVRGTLDSNFPATKGDLIATLDPVALGLPAPADYVAAYLDELRASPRPRGSNRF